MGILGSRISLCDHWVPFGLHIPASCSSGHWGEPNFLKLDPTRKPSEPVPFCQASLHVQDPSNALPPSYIMLSLPVTFFFCPIYCWHFLPWSHSGHVHYHKAYHFWNLMSKHLTFPAPFQLKSSHCRIPVSHRTLQCWALSASIVPLSSFLSCIDSMIHHYNP